MESTVSANDVLAAPMIAIAAVAVHVGIYHLWISVRDSDRRTERAFAGFSLISAVYALATGARYVVPDADAAVVVMHVIDTYGITVAPMLLLFVHRFTKEGNTRFIETWCLSVLALMFATAIIMPLVWSAPAPLVPRVVHFFGQEVRYFDAWPTTMVRTLQTFALASAFIANALVIRAVIHKGPQTRMLAAAIFFCDYTIVHDLLVEMGVLSSIYLLAYGYVGMLVTSTYALTNDVMSAARAERALRASEDRLAIAVAGSNDGLFNWSLDAGNSFYTPRFAELLGASLEELVAAGPYPPALMDLGGRNLREMIEARIDDGDPLDIELEKSEEGGTRWLRLRGRRVEMAGEGIPRFAGSLSDVTARRQAEQRLASSERLESMGRLAGGVAHDFNNMLAGVIAFGELVRTEPGLSDRGRFAAERIVEAGRRATELTTRLLSYARRSTAPSTTFDAYRAIDAALLLLERTVDPRVVIERDLVATNSLVFGDPAQLESAILNLGVNARDAMKDGGILRVEAHNVELDPEEQERLGLSSETTKYLEILVRDTGSGISPKDLEHVLEPFYTTKPPGEGTGLGLASVSTAVEAMEGTIVIDSEVGQGTTVHLFLPAAEARTLTEPAPPIAFDRMYSGVALVVDDQVIVREAIRACLEAMGLHVLTCEDGIEGARVFRKRRDDIVVIVMDLVMPKQSAEETYAALRAIGPHVPIILVSGFDSDGQGTKLIEDDAVTFVAKPFRVRTLMDAVAHAIDTSRSERLAASAR